MNGTSDQDLDDLGKHVAALTAIAQLYDRQPEEAHEAARRVAQALARLDAEPHHVNVAVAAQRLIDAPAGEAQEALADLVANLEREIEAGRRRAHTGVVLVVEDDEWLAELFCHVLATKGWEVEHAGTAEMAEAIVSTRNVSAIVLDLVLPDADGRNVLLRLKQDQRTAPIPVIVASAHDDPHVQAECLALGASNFLKKPVDPKVLVDVITQRAVAPPPLDLNATDIQSEILGVLDSLFEAGTEGPELPIAETPPLIADHAALTEALQTPSDATRAVALIAVAGPAGEGPPPAASTIAEPLEEIGIAIADALGDDELVAHAGAGQLAVLLHASDPSMACQRLETVQEALHRTRGGELEFAAGVVPIDHDTRWEDTLDLAGRLLFVAQKSPDNRILWDAESIPPPTVRILLAEDDEMTAKLLTYRLKREPGFEVFHCDDGLRALATIEAEHIDLAILDINMPGMDGLDLLARIRDMPRYADLPIAMLTALGSENEIVRGFELGANDYIAKPFSPSEVIARVRRLLGRSRRRV